MSPVPEFHRERVARFPRLRGDEPEHSGKLVTYSLFSPPTRG